MPHSQFGILTLAEYSSLTASTEKKNDNHSGLRLFIAASGITTGESVEIKVQIKDDIADTWYDLPGASISVTSNGNYMLTIYPGIGGADADAVLGCVWRLAYTLVGTITLGINGELLV